MPIILSFPNESISFAVNSLGVLPDFITNTMASTFLAITLVSAVKPGGGESLFADAVDRKRIAADIKCGKAVAQHVHIGAGVDERCNDHVTTGTAEAIEVCDVH